LQRTDPRAALWSRLQPRQRLQWPPAFHPNANNRSGSGRAKSFEGEGKPGCQVS
jgi:hypothetical protein